MVYTITAIERLSKKFTISDNGCWDWTGAFTNDGYGTAVVGYKQTSAHRHLYQSIFGVLPKKLHLDHLCRNRACVNPAHLEPVTRKTNILRGESPSAKNKVKLACKNGHDFTDENTYQRFRNDTWERDCKTCRREAVKRYFLKKGVSIGTS